MFRKIGVVCVGVIVFAVMARADIASYPEGDVTANEVRINGKVSTVTVDGRAPVISWQFGDHANLNDVLSYERGYLGSELGDMSEDVAVADMNGDGLPDVVVGNSGYDYYHSEGEQNYVLLNNGRDAATWERRNLGIAQVDRTRGLAVVDVNHDDLADVILANEDQRSVVVINNGFGSETWPRVGLTSNNTWTVRCMDTGDLNGDGLPDAVIGNVGPNWAVLNNGMSPEKWPWYYLGSNMVSDATYDVRICDVTGDGLADVVVANYTTQSVVVVNNGGLPNSWTRVGFGRTNSMDVLSMDIADLNGDGLVDVIMGEQLNACYAMLNDGGNDPSVWTDVNISTGRVRYVTDVKVGDVNADGLPDVVFGKYNTAYQVGHSGSENEVAINNGGALDTWAREKFGSDGLDFAVDIELADINSDGRMDAVLGNCAYAYQSATGYSKNTVLLNMATNAMQEGYCIQVADSTEKLAGEDLVWNSGIVVSSDCAAMQQSMATTAGTYYGRVKVYSTSGFCSDWSAVFEYTVPDDQLLLWVEQAVSPSGWTAMVSDESVIIEGYVSDEADDVTWSNVTSGVTGTIAERGNWSVSVPVVVGENQIMFIAQDAVLGDARCDVSVVSSDEVPDLVIDVPNGGADLHVTEGSVDVSGYLLPTSSCFWGSVVWSNEATGMTDTESIAEDGSFPTNVLTIDLRVCETNVIHVSAGTVFGYAVDDVIRVVRDLDEVPEDLTLYSTGLVHISRMRLDGECNKGVIGTFMPEFSWEFGDELNRGTMSDWETKHLGVLCRDTTYALDAADFNGDGLTDVVLGNHGSFNVVLLNNGGDVDTWSRYVLGEFADDQTIDIAAVDMNNDGRMDVIEAHNDAVVTYCLNNGGTPDCWERRVFVCDGGMTCAGQSLAVGDVTGDGRKDVVAGGSTTSNYVLINGGGPDASWSMSALSGSCTGLARDVCIADVNGDGLQDVIEGNSAHSDSGYQNCVVLNNGGAPSTWARVALGGASAKITYGVAAGDVNGDGYLDVAEGNVDAAGHVALSYIVVNNGGSPDTWERVVLGSNAYARTESIMIADITGDGHPDVIQGNIVDSEYVPSLGRTPSFGENNVFVNNGCSPDSWGVTNIGPMVRESTRCVAVTDLNGDGRLDLLEANASNDADRRVQNCVVLGGTDFAQKGYHLQVAVDENSLNAGTCVYDSQVVTGCLMRAKLPLVNLVSRTYCWRVKCYSSCGWQSEWSDIQQFTISDTAYNLQISRPVDGSVVTQSTVFVEGISTYTAPLVNWQNTKNSANGSFFNANGCWTHERAFCHRN